MQVQAAKRILLVEADPIDVQRRLERGYE